MNQRDFRDWLEHHSAAFPDWARMLNRLTPQTLEQWRALLIGSSLEATKRATDEMLSGDLRRPFQLEAHITEIAKRARELTTAAIVSPHEDEAYYCPTCSDSLYVSIVHPRSVVRAQAGEFNAWLDWYHGGQIGMQPSRRGWVSAAVQCHCRRAVEFKRLQKQEQERTGSSLSPLPTYDSREHIKWETYKSGFSWADVIAELIAAAIELKPRNYVSGFDDYNAGR